MSDIHTLSGAYALDALDDIERGGFERHVATCPACSDEVEGLRLAAAELSHPVCAHPPAALRTQVLTRVQTVRPLPRHQLSHVKRVPKRRRIVTLVAAASTVVALGSGAAAVWHPWRPETVQLSLAERIRQAPDAQTWSQALPDGGRVTVIRSMSIGKTLMVTSGLDATPSGRVYQLWLMAADKSLTSAGLMSSGDGDVVLRGDSLTAIGAGVSIEPSGGSPQPTTKPIAFIDFRANS